MIRHCLTCGCTHNDEFSCPASAFAHITCKDCGNDFIQPWDSLFMMSETYCGQCPSKGQWNVRQATEEDLRKSWMHEYKPEKHEVGKMLYRTRKSDF